jgi:hypothetical protein
LGNIKENKQTNFKIIYELPEENPLLMMLGGRMDVLYFSIPSSASFYTPFCRNMFWM